MACPMQQAWLLAFLRSPSSEDAGVSIADTNVKRVRVESMHLSKAYLSIMQLSLT